MRKILIADDHSLFGSGFASLLEKNGFEVVGQVLNGRDVLYKTISLQPDVIILDLNLPKKNGLDVLREIKEYQEKIVVIVVTMYSDGYLIGEVKKHGGSGYFLKNSDQDELLSQIGSLQAGDFYLTKSVKLQQEEHDLIEDDFPSVVKLTKREKEILSLLVVGMSSKDIAVELDISPATVDTHRKNMLKKLSFNKVSELVSYAHRNNLI